jgi:hypothetical protein
MYLGHYVVSGELVACRLVKEVAKEMGIYIYIYIYLSIILCLSLSIYVYMYLSLYVSI